MTSTFRHHKKLTPSFIQAVVSGGVYFFLPVLVFAQQTPTTFKSLVNVFLQIITFHLIPLLFAVVFVFFVWKTIDAWVINVADEKKRLEGKSYLIAAIVFFVLAASVWGLVRMFASSFFGT